MVQVQAKQTFNLPGSDAALQTIIGKCAICVREMVEILPVSHTEKCRPVDDLRVSPWRILCMAKQWSAREFLKIVQPIQPARE